MKRRASSEIFGVMAVGAALAIAMGIIMQSSVELVYGGKVTVRDTMDEYKGQISELVQVVGTFNNPASVELINYGSSPIIIDQVRIDSENTSYTIYEYDALGEIQEIDGVPFMSITCCFVGVASHFVMVAEALVLNCFSRTLRFSSVFA